MAKDKKKKGKGPEQSAPSPAPYSAVDSGRVLVHLGIAKRLMGTSTAESI